MVIGHGKRGLARVYDQHEYIDEMREALEAWAAKLRSIIAPPPRQRRAPRPGARMMARQRKYRSGMFRFHSRRGLIPLEKLGDALENLQAGLDASAKARLKDALDSFAKDRLTGAPLVMEALPTSTRRRVRRSTT